MEADGWSRFVPHRFEGEDLQTYNARSVRIVEIMTGFRMGRFHGDIAELKERELVRLQEVGLERLSA
jgi:hypothetical protein